MNNDWPLVVLSEVTSTLGDGLHGTPSYTPDGEYHFINGNNLKNGNIVFDEKTKRCDRAEFLKHRKPLGDRTVLVSINGTLGNVAFYSGEKVILGKSACYFNVLDQVDKRFVGYIVSGPIFQKYLESISTGTTIKNVSLRSMRDFSFRLPPLSQQIAISEVLGSLDDKIELNRRMNETLQEIARALFRDWFVTFGPTRRQMEGTTDPAAIMGHAFPPGKATTLAPLFPAKLGDDGLPEGWEERPFEAFVEIVGGGTPKTKVAEYWGGDIPWFSVVDAPTKGAVYVLSTEKNITEAGLDNSSACTVPEGTTIISARGTVGKIGMASGDMTFNQSCYALRPKDPAGERFVYLATERMVERLQAMAHGSVFSTITRSTFASLNFAGAAPETLAAFEANTDSIFAKIKANGQENQTLAALRDLLLPKFMSGEIRLRDAEDDA